jgi:hypothetical protein
VRNGLSLLRSGHNRLVCLLCQATGETATGNNDSEPSTFGCGNFTAASTKLPSSVCAFSAPTMARSQANAPFGGLAPSLVTAQHSQIQQEANYVQERITAAKSSARKINAEIRRIEDKIKQARDNLQPRTMIDAYKKSRRRHRSRLNRCEKNRKVWEDRLDGVGVEIRILAQKQWRHNGAPEFARVESLHWNDNVPVAHWRVSPTESFQCIPPLLQTDGSAVQMAFSQSQQELYQQTPIPLQCTPTLRPMMFPPLRTQTLQSFAAAFTPAKHRPSPTDTISTLDLSSPNGPVAVQMS